MESSGWAEERPTRPASPPSRAGWYARCDSSRSLASICMVPDRAPVTPRYPTKIACAVPDPLAARKLLKLLALAGFAMQFLRGRAQSPDAPCLFEQAAKVGSMHPVLPSGATRPRSLKIVDKRGQPFSILTACRRDGHDVI